MSGFNSLVEIWKPVVGYEGIYEVSNMGRVKSLDRLVKRNNHFDRKKGRILSPSINSLYPMVRLSKNGEHKSTFLHRIIAIAFIPNPNNKPQVNHIDGNKHNYSISNLEWCTQSENNAHAFATGLKFVTDKQRIFMRNREVKNKKSVIMINPQNGLVEKFNSIADAGNKTGIFWTNISKCCNGKQKKAGGYEWRFAS